MFVYPKEGHTWFLARHGKPYAREAVIEAGESVGRYFRPEKFDVLAYNPVIWEIRMNAETKGGKELCRKKFGFHLFGDEEFFNERSRFDLEPSRQMGEDALLCDDVDGVESVRLKEVQVFWGALIKTSKFAGLRTFLHPFVIEALHSRVDGKSSKQASRLSSRGPRLQDL